MEYLLHRALCQLHAHKENDHGDDEAGDILQPPVAERMLRIGPLPRQLEAEQRHDARSRVGEVIEGVRRHGDGAGERTGKQLERKEQHIKADADDAAENAVGLPHSRIGHIGAVFDKALGKKRDHTFVSISLDFAGKKNFLVNR